MLNFVNEIIINYMFFKKSLAIVLVLMQIVVTAQISTHGTPSSFGNSTNTIIPVIEINNNIPQELKSNGKIQLAAGYTLPFDDKNLNTGKWIQINNGFAWRINIFVKNASALNIYFNNLNLATGEKLFLYNPNHKKILGAFTNANNGQYMCTDFVDGSNIIIEFNTKTKQKHLPFSVHEVGVLINDQNSSRGFGNAGICEVHVNCEEGENWQREKDGVTRILVKQHNSTFWCSGSLINNTENNGIPYFLTANHCGEFSDSTDYAQWLFYFNYESNDCQQPLIEPEPINTLSGATMLAHAPSGTTNGSDFKLLLLKTEVPKDYKPYYNGWDINDVASPNGTTIHHPQGDLKMISTYTTPLESARYNSQSPSEDGMYWMVKWAETVSGHGVTEGGSSGSPLFNANKLIVGALTGGFASCANLTAPDYYGKLSVSWDPPNSDSTSQIKYWLDPKLSGVTTLKGNDLDSTNVFAGAAANPTSIIIGEYVTFINTSFGNISSYNWFFEGGNPQVSELKEPGNIKYETAGSFDVKLIVASPKDADTILLKDYITVLPNISPNPSNGKFKLAFGDALPTNIENYINVINSVGQQTSFMVIEKTTNYIIIEIMPRSQGIYFVSLSAENINNTYKVVVY